MAGPPPITTLSQANNRIVILEQALLLVLTIHFSPTPLSVSEASTLQGLLTQLQTYYPRQAGTPFWAFAPPPS